MRQHQLLLTDREDDVFTRTGDGALHAYPIQRFHLLITDERPFISQGFFNAMLDPVPGVTFTSSDPDRHKNIILKLKINI